MFRRQALPREWANTEVNLGNAFTERIDGDRADNLEKAIAAYEAALTVVTVEASPREWAGIQNNLGAVYRARMRGELADNLEKSIALLEAAFYTRRLGCFERAPIREETRHA